MLLSVKLVGSAIKDPNVNGLYNVTSKSAKLRAKTDFYSFVIEKSFA